MAKYNIVGAGAGTLTPGSVTWYAPPSPPNLEYLSNFGDKTVEAAAEYTHVGGDVTISDLYINVATSSTSAATTVTLRKNQADSSLTVSIAGSTTGFFADTSNSVTLSDGDDFSFKFVFPASGSIVFTGVSYQADASTFKFARGISPYAGSASSDFAYLTATATDAVSQHSEMLHGGTISDLRVYVETNTYVTNTATIEVRKNGSVGNLSVSIAPGVTGVLSDSSGSDTFSAGDRLSYNASVTVESTKSLIATTISTALESSGGTQYTTDNVNRFGTGTNYTPISIRGSTDTTESNVLTTMPAAGTLSNMQVYASTNTFTQAVSITLRTGNTGSMADSAVGVSVTASTTGWFTDSDSVSISADEEACYSSAAASGSGFLSTWIEVLFEPEAANVGAAAGTSTASAVGASSFATVGAASGTGTASGTSAATSASVGSAAGTGAATATGASLSDGVGSAAGTGAANGVGDSAGSTVEAAGAASGTGAASAVGAADASAVASLTGTSTVSATGLSLAAIQGEVAGTSSVDAASASSAASVGSSVGTGTASAAGALVYDVVGSSSGAGSATGASASDTASVASASGLGVASGIGASESASVGSTAGIGSASATGLGLFLAVGSSAGTGAGAATSAVLSSATATASGTGTASATGISTSQSVAASSGAGTAAGSSTASSAAVGASAGTGTASGVGQGTAQSVGSASGAGAATAVSAAAAASAGSSAGTSSVASTGRSDAAATASVTATGSAAATGASRFDSVASSSGAGSAAATSLVLYSGVGSAAGVGVASGAGFKASRSLPSADVDINNWTDEASGTTNIFNSINEHAANDDDYIQSPSLSTGQSDTTEFMLSAIGDPALSANHVIRYRYGKDGSETIDLTVYLVQGTTVIASWTHTNVSAGWSDAVQTLSTGEADAITDYSDLRIRFLAAA